MAEPTPLNELHCPVEYAFNIIGGKWKVLLLSNLYDGGTMRFAELKRANEDITQKVLTQQLRELEADGLIARKVYAEVPPKVEYSLTPIGKTIEPILHALCEWGTRYYELQRKAKAAS